MKRSDLWNVAITALLQFRYRDHDIDAEPPPTGYGQGHSESIDLWESQKVMEWRAAGRINKYGFLGVSGRKPEPFTAQQVRDMFNGTMDIRRAQHVVDYLYRGVPWTNPRRKSCGVESAEPLNPLPIEEPSQEKLAGMSVPPAVLSGVLSTQDTVLASIDLQMDSKQ